MRGRRRRKEQSGALIGRRLAYLHVSMRPHGSFLAGEVGELAGVTGNTVGQWARRGLIRSSQSDGEPRVYSIEDINEASVVAELIGRGVRHADVHRATERLARRYGRWPL